MANGGGPSGPRPADGEGGGGRGTSEDRESDKKWEGQWGEWCKRSDRKTCNIICLATRA